MSEANPLQQLYDREINFKVEALCNGGFDVALGDALNGDKARLTSYRSTSPCTLRSVSPTIMANGIIKDWRMN